MVVKVPEITVYESIPSRVDSQQLDEEISTYDDNVEIIETDFNSIVQKFNRVLLQIDDNKDDLPRLRVESNVIEFNETITESLKRLQEEFEELERQFKKDNDGLNDEQIESLKQLLNHAKDKLLASTFINPALNLQELSDCAGDGFSIPADVSKMSERLSTISSAIGQPSDSLRGLAKPLEFVVEGLTSQLESVPSNSQANSELNVALNEIAKQNKDDTAIKINDIYEILSRWNTECAALPLILERLRHCAALSEQAGDLLNKKLEILTVADSIGKELTGLKDSGTSSAPQIRKELENILKKAKAL